MRKIVGFIAVVVLFTACFKDESYESDIVIRPYQQLYDGADFTPLTGVVAHAFVADEEGDVEDLEVLSYEDALAGVVRLVETGEELTPFASSSPYESALDYFEGAVSIHVNQPWIYIVVADTENEDYAYGFYEVGLNLPTSYITLLFRSWYDSVVETGDWVYVVPVANDAEAPDSDIPTVSIVR